MRLFTVSSRTRIQFSSVQLSACSVNEAWYLHPFGTNSVNLISALSDVLQAFSNGIFRAAEQQLTRYQLIYRTPHCPSTTGERLAESTALRIIYIANAIKCICWHLLSDNLNKPMSEYESSTIRLRDTRQTDSHSKSTFRRHERAQFSVAAREYLTRRE